MIKKQDVENLIQNLDRCINNKCYHGTPCPYGKNYGMECCVDVLMKQSGEAIAELYKNRKDPHYIMAKTAAHWLDLCPVNCGWACKACPFQDCSEQLLRTASKLLRIARNELFPDEQKEDKYYDDD